MWVITYRGKPATLDKLYDLERNTQRPTNFHRNEWGMYLAAPTRRGAIAGYLYHFGFTWGERTEGVECHKTSVLE